MFWKNLFGNKKANNPYVLDAGQGVFLVRVRTLAHHDELEVRFTKSAHIGAAEEGNGYVLRKPIVSNSLDRGEIAVFFDSNYRVTGTEAQGVEFIAVGEWPKD
ncbi:hypothetical protein [Deinococcus sp.]|uniref:hypothetical protein n=1 Tax=Deinococcus sp. TaxID=47478 RepID=UPI0025E3AB72|nr:hypothetical protein [Deinococcus sp.]